MVCRSMDDRDEHPAGMLPRYAFPVLANSQQIGFSIGGILRRFVVNPPSMSTSLMSLYT